MKYSVIIPAYNIEKYCTDIIDFIKNTIIIRDDVEFIIINDGSTDNTDHILSSEKYIHYIKQDNKGVSASRNLGLKLATADNILFLDADDSFSNNIFTILDHEISHDNERSDLYLFNYSINNRVVENSILNKCKHSNNKILHLILRHKISFHLCSICFNRDFILKNNLKFSDNYKFGEDIHFILSSLMRTKKDVHYINKTLFNYNWNNSVTVKSPVTKNKIDVLDLYHSLESDYILISKNTIRDITYFKHRTFFYLIKLGFKFNLKDKETLDYLFSKKNVLKNNRNLLYPVVLCFYLFEKIIYLVLSKRLQ